MRNRVRTIALTGLLLTLTSCGSSDRGAATIPDQEMPLIGPPVPLGAPTKGANPPSGEPAKTKSSSAS